MLLINEGKYDLETECLLEVLMHQPAEELTGDDVNLAIDAFLEIENAEIK